MAPHCWSVNQSLLFLSWLIIFLRKADVGRVSSKEHFGKTIITIIIIVLHGSEFITYINNKKSLLLPHQINKIMALNLSFL